jgi:hypothetical protein
VGISEIFEGSHSDNDEGPCAYALLHIPWYGQRLRQLSRLEANKETNGAVPLLRVNVHSDSTVHELLPKHLILSLSLSLTVLLSLPYLVPFCHSLLLSFSISITGSASYSESTL